MSSADHPGAVGEQKAPIADGAAAPLLSSSDARALVTQSAEFKDLARSGEDYTSTSAVVAADISPNGQFAAVQVTTRTSFDREGTSESRRWFVVDLASKSVVSSSLQWYNSTNEWGRGSSSGDTHVGWDAGIGAELVSKRCYDGVEEKICVAAPDWTNEVKRD